jgi:hypothetical protein
LLGDVAQHESVGSGAVLRGLAEEHEALDLRDTRRAREPWLREVAQDDLEPDATPLAVLEASMAKAKPDRKPLAICYDSTEHHATDP